MNHRWARSLDGQNPAPVERQYILLFTGVLYIPGGAEFLPSTVPPYVVCRLNVFYTYTFSTKTLTLDELLGCTWRMVDVPSTLDHLGARCTILAVHPLTFGYEQKDLLRRGFSVWGSPLVLWHRAPKPLVRFEPKKKGRLGKHILDVQQKTNRLCYGL